MSIKKRLAALALALAMLAGLSACDQADNNVGTDEGIVTTQTETEETISPEEAKLNQLLENKTTLRFDESGEFRVLVLSDLHIPATGMTEKGMGNIREVVEKEQPDLIILDGDNVVDGSIASEEMFKAALDSVVSYFESQKIYWMHVYGNHDLEMGVNLEQQQAIYESYEHCLSKDPNKEITGVGNYVIPIYGSDDDEVKFAVWGIDSNSTLSGADREALFGSGVSAFAGYDAATYDYIHFDQIEWYRETSELMESQFGQKIPGLMAFHIPLQESYVAWRNRKKLESTGSKLEDVCASPYNSGFFEVLRNYGDIKAVVNGHDHTNDFMVNYAGIKLCYATTVTNTAYGGNKGARVFVINESNPAQVDTYISYLSSYVSSDK
jgi:3',5'-cyclic AMP phosphodiesterase CpdA